MKLKTIERLLSVLLLAVWILLLVRAHSIVPKNSFNDILSVVIVGSLAVLIVVVMSFIRKRPLLPEKESKVEAGPGPA